MAGSSNFEIFNPNGNNMLSDTNYQGSSYRLNGIQPQESPPSNAHNKLYYQLSSMVTALAQVFANLGFTMTDSNYSGLLTALETTVTTQGAEMTGALQFAAPQTVTSNSGVLTLNNLSNSYFAQGNEAITSIAGTTQGFYLVTWQSQRTLTNGTNLKLLGNVNRTTAFGDTGIYQIVGSVVTELFYMPFSGSYTPPGTMLQTFCSAPPSGYLACNGSAISRTTYANLFAAIGVTYGVGDGVSTFNLPNCNDKFLLSLGTTYTNLGATGGEAVHTLTVDEIPSHNHPFPGDDHILNAFAASSSGLSRVETLQNWDWTSNASNQNPNGWYNPGVMGNAGGGQAHNNIPPYIVILTCIKY